MIPAGEEDDGDTTSIVLTQEPNGVVNMELDMLAAASEAEARIAEEKLQAEIEKKAMADEDRLAAPASAKKRKGEKVGEWEGLGLFFTDYNGVVYRAVLHRFE